MILRTDHEHFMAHPQAEARALGVGSISSSVTTDRKNQKFSDGVEEFSRPRRNDDVSFLLLRLSRPREPTPQSLLLAVAIAVAVA